MTTPQRKREKRRYIVRNPTAEKIWRRILRDANEDCAHLTGAEAYLGEFARAVVKYTALYRIPENGYPS